MGPIGSPNDLFRGTYDGAGFTIDGLRITSGHYVGLFGATERARLENIVLTNVSVTGEHYVGGLVGSAQGTSITKITISGAVAGALRVGGVAGDAVAFETTRSSVNHVTSTVAITAVETPRFSQFGGVVGFLSESDISMVSTTGAVTGSFDVGGVVGQAHGGSTVTYSLSRGTVSGQNNVGGLIGSSYQSRVADSYAIGPVTATDVDAVVGGVVGYVEGVVPPPPPGVLEATADIERTYSRGAVSGGSYAGGLLGYLNPNGSILASHWNQTVNPARTGIGLNESSVTVTDPPGSTLTDLQTTATYSGWTIVDGWSAFAPPTAIWGICDDTPYLLWEFTESPCVVTWNVDGFFPPIRMNGHVNSIPGKLPVPLIWRIRTSTGDPVSDPASFIALTISPVSCVDPKFLVATRSGVTTFPQRPWYVGRGFWVLLWVPPKASAGSCVSASVALNDGSSLQALFRYKH